ncbi:Endonuclease/exonuclease/phosphatase, partial [Dillenia turbinata]
MGNSITTHSGKEEHNRRRTGFKRRTLKSVESHAMIHEGIKSIKIDKNCDFSESPEVCFVIITWNMNGKEVAYEDIEALVGDDRKFDLLVVGLQEAPGRNISRLFEEALLQTHSLIGEAIMQSLQLYVFGPKNSELFTKGINIDKQSIGGCGGFNGRKKGAVAISINFKGIQIVFISCHLSAHARKVETRNAEFRRISRSLFANRNPYARPCQVTVWLGDLNYRLHGIGTFPARNLIKKNLHKVLRGKDQLLQEAERGQIFNGYSEGSLRFKPTYKYDIGSSIYDTSHKERVPSWTDRILFKVEEPENISATLHSYESIDHIDSSDHKPVKAHLCLRLNEN